MSVRHANDLLSRIIARNVQLNEELRRLRRENARLRRRLGEGAPARPSRARAAR